MPRVSAGTHKPSRRYPFSRYRSGRARAKSRLANFSDTFGKTRNTRPSAATAGQTDPHQSDHQGGVSARTDIDGSMQPSKGGQNKKTSRPKHNTSLHMEFFDAN